MATFMHCNTHIFWHADLSCSYMPPKRLRFKNQGIRNGMEATREEREVKRKDSGEFEKGSPIEVRLNEEELLEDERVQSALSIREKASTPDIARPETPKHDAPSMRVLDFLLSNAAFQWCRPQEENKDVKHRGDKLITYSQLLSPFEELLCAVIVSRPIPHRLCLRAIRTVLNPPYEFRHPVSIKMAGSKKVQQALWSERTQHKGRTAEEIDVIADAIANNDWHNDLPKIRKQTKNATGPEREILERKIKGLGQDGLDVFYRRIQWCWPEVYPFIDQKAQAALKQLGLPTQAESIEKMIEARWADLQTEPAGEFTEEERKRRAFVMLLERAVGAEIERNIEEVLEEASKP